MEFYHRAGPAAVLHTASTSDRTPILSRNSEQVTTGGGPHIFALAENAYRTMVTEEENQCVIISGESGAGKTEAAKHIMQYVSAVSGNTAEMRRVKEIILQTNPLLEAFGNAKTLRNDNSSRFGKFFQMYFNHLGGPVGGRMETFLLEKSRVVKQQKGERNFHIFYQLCAGLSDGEEMGGGGEVSTGDRARLRIGAASSFSYLSQGQTLQRDGVNDASEWRATLAAMEVIGMASVDQTHVKETLAIILHLGQISFLDDGGDVGAPCRIQNRETLVFVAELMQVDVAVLERALTWRRLEMGSSEVVNVPLDLQQCQQTRDAVSKALYDQLFAFIVAAVNRALGDSPFSLMFGVLDIYGFEVFDNNGFEQFCINFVNEKLQQIFIDLTLRVEQEEYVRERIPWEDVPYFDNRVVCELLEGTNPPGLFSIIDDVCASMAKEPEAVADQKLLGKLNLVHSNSALFHRGESGFTVRHYAGDVLYNSSGFTARNKDRLTPDVLKVLSSCRHSFILEMLTPILTQISESDGLPRRTMATASTTVGYKIRQQAAALVATLRQCNPHYVRTIKPNDEKRAACFDDARVLHQVKYLGLLENVRVRRAGYSYRQYFDRFLRRFRFICPETFPRPFRGADRAACEVILNFAEQQHPRQPSCVLPSGSWQLGTSKVFIRQPMHLSALEELREAVFDRLACKIQRIWGKYCMRKEFVALKNKMRRVYAARGKQRRPDSVFRPYHGDYLEIKTRYANTELLALINYDPVGSAWKEVWSESNFSGSADHARSYGSGVTSRSMEARAPLKYYANLVTQQAQWMKPIEMSSSPTHKILFSAKVGRLRVPLSEVPLLPSATPEIEVNLLVLTERALFLFQEVIETAEPVTAGKGVARRTKKSKGAPQSKGNTTLAAAPPTGSASHKICLKKRVDVRLFSSVSLTNQADDVVVLHVLPVVPPYRPVHLTLAKATKHCESCGAKFFPAMKKYNCPCCGRLCCVQRCLVTPRPLPSLLGHTKSVKVCPLCIVGEPLEPLEDMVLQTSYRTELVALLCHTYHHRMNGNPLSIRISSDSIAFFSAIPASYSSNCPLSQAPCFISSAVDPAAEDTVIAFLAAPTANTPAPPTAGVGRSFVVTSPPGITAAQIQLLDKAREERQRAAEQRRREEETEMRRQEAIRERQREEEHRRMIEERKRARAEAQLKAEEDRLAREEAAREQREAAARIVAERSRRIL